MNSSNLGIQNNKSTLQIAMSEMKRYDFPPSLLKLCMLRIIQDEVGAFASTVLSADLIDKLLNFALEQGKI
jgi:hypothetical protein